MISRAARPFFTAAFLLSFALVPALAQTTPDKTVQPAVVPVTPVEVPQPQTPKHEFRSLLGLELGMTVDQVREKLGKPEFQDATGLVFDLDDGDSIQIGLGPDKNVRTIAAVFSAESKVAPSFADVFGPDASVANGDVYKMERYPDAGYWVSFSRSNSADKPVTVVTLRKIF